jgi:hypothetical protein
MTKNKQTTALCVALSAALAAGAGADVGLAASGHHSKRKKKKGHHSSSRTVVVHCASISVRCEGTPGSRGPQGAKGPNGRAGPDGQRGVAVIARARSMQPLQTKASGDFDNLTGNHWVQGPTDDERILGVVTFTAPMQCHTGTGRVTIQSFLDGQIIGYSNIAGTPGQTETDSLSLPRQGNNINTPEGDLMADGATHDHVLSTHVSDNCTTANDGHYVVQKVGYDVASFG